MSKGIRFKKNTDLCKVYSMDVVSNSNSFISNASFDNGHTFLSSGAVSGRYLRTVRFVLPNQWDRLNVCMDVFDKEQMRGLYTLYLGMMNTSSINVSVRTTKCLSISNSEFLQVTLLKINSTTLEMQIYTGRSNYVTPVIAFHYIVKSNSNIKIELLNNSWTNTETQDYSTKLNFTSI